jgi:hypothetical protein
MSHMWLLCKKEKKEKRGKLTKKVDKKSLSLEQRIKYLEEFNRFLKSDVIDISSLEEFKKYRQRQREQEEQVQKQEQTQVQIQQDQVQEQKDQVQQNQQDQVQEQQDQPDQIHIIVQ